MATVVIYGDKADGKCSMHAQQKEGTELHTYMRRYIHRYVRIYVCTHEK